MILVSKTYLFFCLKLVEMDYHRKEHIRAMNKSCMHGKELSLFWVSVPLKIFLFIFNAAPSSTHNLGIYKILATALHAQNGRL